MKELEDKILHDGIVKPGGVLKVDMFLNHQLDPRLIYDMAVEWKRLYEGERIDKILTIEASGIALGIMAGYMFDCPVVFAKKGKSKNISDDVYYAKVYSFTHGNVNDIIVSKEYLKQGERVLIIDDFLATGSALIGLIDLCSQAGSEIVGCGIAVEKVFQGGGNELRDKGIRIESLAMISGMTDDSIEFV